MGEADGDNKRASRVGRVIARATAADPRVWLHGLAGLATAGLALMICVTGVSPRAGLERWCSDHYSHTGATVLFLDQGLDVYRRPVGAHCQPSSRGRDPRLERQRRALAKQWDVNPIDVCFRRVSAQKKSSSRPVVVNWQRFPRPYPRG